MVINSVRRKESSSEEDRFEDNLDRRPTQVEWGGPNDIEGQDSRERTGQKPAEPNHRGER